jgi:hypothetical protein
MLVLREGLRTGNQELRPSSPSPPPPFQRPLNTLTLTVMTMNRRQFQSAGLAAAAGGWSAALAAETSGPACYELRTYELRNDLAVARFHTFLEKTWLPAIKPFVSGPVGVFNVVFGLPTPSVVLLLQYPSPSGLKANTELTSLQASWVAEWKQFESGGMPWVRYQSQLFRAFDGHPHLEKPAANPDGHYFELRTYESSDSFRSAAKIQMFNLEEIQIFRACGILPVFFGEALIGSRLPQLTYMSAYADPAAREQAWDKFRVHPDWIRIKDDLRWVDTVSSISVSFLRSTAYSEIR